MYNQAYKKNYKSNFLEYLKAMNLSILNRTTWKKSKAFKSGRDDSSKCENYNQDKHFFWENLQTIVQESKSKSGVLNITKEHIIYLKGILLLTHSENKQLLEIIQEVKQQIYSSRRQTYKNIRRNAHLRKLIVQIKV